MLIATQLIGFGAGIPADWYTLYSAATDTAGSGWGSYNARNIFSSLDYSGLPSTAMKVRVTFSAVGATSTFNIASAYVGHPGVGDAYDFDGGQAQLLFSGGATAAITAGNTLLSDELTFAFSSTKHLIVSIGFGATSHVGRKTSGLPANFSMHDKAAAAGDAGTTDVTGYTSEGYLVGVSKIEVFG